VNTLIARHRVGITANGSSQASMDGILWGTGTWANKNDTAGAGSFQPGKYIFWGDPGFVNPSLLDYHILSTSAVIDKGIVVPGISDDGDGQARPNPDTGIPDIGADEYYPAP
jgi:hypothetical protein